MAPLNERMELRLDADLSARLQAWCAQQDGYPTKSEGARRLIEEGLRAPEMKQFSLSKQENLIVWLLTEIRKGQIQATAQRDKKYTLDEMDFIQKTIFGGHYWGLEWQMTGLIHDYADNKERVSLVVNVMDCWMFIETAWERFDTEERAKVVQATGFPGEPRFLGFDGNNEGEYMGIAMYLVEQLNRFQHFKDRDMNSHMRTVTRYSRMADLFDTIRPSLAHTALSPDQMIRLLRRDV